MLEGTTHDRRLGVVPRYWLAAVEGLAKGNARGGEEFAAPRRNAAELAIPEDVRYGLPTLAARATHLSEHRAERVRTRGVIRSASEEPDAIVAQRHHEAALLVVEFGMPQELEAAAVGVQRGGRRVLSAHVQVVYLQHELALRAFGVVTEGAVAAGRGWERHRVAP